MASLVSHGFLSPRSPFSAKLGLKGNVTETCAVAICILGFRLLDSVGRCTDSCGEGSRGSMAKTADLGFVAIGLQWAPVGLLESIERHPLFLLASYSKVAPLCRTWSAREGL